MERVWGSGEAREVRLGEGVVRYREIGEGEPVLFVHGFLVNGGLWRNVAPPLSEHFRCIVPDWPLGAHTLAMEAGADLTPPGLARLVASFMDALDLRDVTLVGNDTGGAISQIVIAHHPERVGRLVLNNCDAFEHFPPPLILPLKWCASMPGFTGTLANALRLPPVKRLLYALVARRQPGRAVLDSYFAPLIRDRGVRRDVTKVMRAVSRNYMLEAARAFPTFRKPVLIAWGEDDLLFPIRDAERLQATFPDARLARVARSRCFIPEDQPRQLVELLETFLTSRAGAIR